MNMPYPLKQFSHHLTHPLGHHTTELALSTGLLAAAQTGCFTRDGEVEEVGGPDAGEAIVEPLAWSEPEARVHSYTEVPGRHKPLVVRLDLEDAPRQPPPRKRRSASRIEGEAAEADPLAAADPARAIEDDERPTRRPATRRPAPRIERDPVAGSYLDTMSTSGVTFGVR
jgi:hypothetical protein